MLIWIALSLLSSIQGIAGVICHQCNGWHGGGYKPGRTAVSTCDNRNNECLTTQYCVKIVDPIDPDVHYATFKSDCWFQTTVQTNSSITTTITNKACYPWSDGGQPPKQYLYCFCNDKDFCNGTNGQKFGLTLFFVVLSLFWLS